MRRGVKVDVGIGVTVIALCVGVGLALSQDSEPSTLITAYQKKLIAFNNLKSFTDVEAKAIAEDLVAVNNLNPAGLGFENGRALLYIRAPGALWERVFRQDIKHFRVLSVRDFDGAFERRWNAGLSKRFGAMSRTSSTPYFQPAFGRISIKPRKPVAGSTNPLEYLEFSKSP